MIAIIFIISHHNTFVPGLKVISRAMLFETWVKWHIFWRGIFTARRKAKPKNNIFENYLPFFHFYKLAHPMLTITQFSFLMHHFKLYNLVVFHISTRLQNHHHYLISGFYHHKKRLYTHQQSFHIPPCPVLGNHRFTFCHYKQNHRFAYK